LLHPKTGKQENENCAIVGVDESYEVPQKL
jgi:hypothetical protein